MKLTAIETTVTKSKGYRKIEIPDALCKRIGMSNRVFLTVIDGTIQISSHAPQVAISTLSFNPKRFLKNGK